MDLEPPAPVPGASATSTTEEESGEAEADNNADAEAKTPSLIGKNPHDEEGEGEEDEQTVHSVKLQVYRMQDNAWANLGAGMIFVHYEEKIVDMFVFQVFSESKSTTLMTADVYS